MERKRLRSSHETSFIGNGPAYQQGATNYRLPLAPHKIFLWNTQGVYVDCAFPMPVHGHFVGGHALLGAQLEDVFAEDTTRQMLQTIRQVVRHQKPQEAVLEFARRGINYHATVFFMPMAHHAMGWVTDHSTCRQRKASGSLGAPQFGTGLVSPLTLLTQTEQRVAKAFGPGHSNRQIADALQMSDRMVRFHMGNLLHKLQLPSRARLAHLRLFESHLNDSQ